ncbi:hypothetical protein GQ55_4G291600 [Panicum hallii var. hallii]|uniref:Uncharacterized protein n=1 Tax=Panicum hallii var. hallii TaxID=1504633 RepID=A0A2T7E1C5_9POAL|nr:hypothetical protein GQ55_4G291600 [Panicum hallii var. hallii]
MRMESDFHMVNGVGETSYVNNSMDQQKALVETKPVLEKAVAEVCSAALPRNLVVCDLGCGSGKNTLIFLSEVVNATRGHPVELQFFLNDLPGNDFNHIFQSFEQLKNSTAADHKGERLPPFYITGVPGSYYTRLFPFQSVHLFHSSFSLHWHSQFPDVLDGNKANIYIAKTTPPSVVKLYQEQFQKDLGKEEDIYSGSMNYLYELLAQSLQSLVEKDLVNQKKLNSFNLPIYGASVTEVKEVVNQSGLFDINHINLFDGVNIAKSIRTVMETLLVSHFGEFMIEALFKEFASKVAEYLQREDNTKYSIIILSLQKK